MVTTAVLAWSMLASLVAGVALSWTINSYLVKTIYAIERARHHWQATKDWLGRLVYDFKRLAVLALLISGVVVAGGVGAFLWVTDRLPVG